MFTSIFKAQITISLQIKWLENEQEFIPDGDRVKSYVNDDGTFGLVFNTTEAADKGTYTAIAYSGMSTSATVIRGVKGGPENRCVYNKRTIKVWVSCC